MRRAVHLTLVVVAVLTLVTTGSDARSRKVRTRLEPSTISWTKTGSDVTSIEGTITSEKSKCVPGRKVVIQVSPNQTLQSLYGTGTTDASGHFSISGSAPVGYYYAIYVAKARIEPTRCKSTAAFGQLT